MIYFKNIWNKSTNNDSSCLDGVVTPRYILPQDQRTEEESVGAGGGGGVGGD